MEDLRQQIDQTDAELLRLFQERMEISAKIAAWKKENDVPVLDKARERKKLQAVADAVPGELRDDARLFMSTLMGLSRSCQHRLNGESSLLSEEIGKAISDTPELFPREAAVACQGVEGANSQLATSRLFRNANILYFSSFEAVFSAIEKGLCRYGILPLENSTAGSVNSVYDLMMKHDFKIVRSVRLKVDHYLLALPGTKLSDIREIRSHEQAISQCSEFLKSLPGVRIVPCENTAAAAKYVAESGRHDVASLSSRACIEEYGLSCLKASVQDSSGNYTRFICISKDLEIYPGADRTSLMATLVHEPGSLYQLLSRLYVLGINLIKLESRPLPDRSFEFMFYFDLDIPVYQPEFRQLILELPSVTESFTYLGSYSEVI
ncbi:MAG: chorismate mutase [Lachnospiraceae bacterium]|nr:chorismate mutase [Lachnospiraceae bacterium]